MMTIEVWYNLLKKLTQNTDYDVIMKDQIKQNGGGDSTKMV